MRPVIQTPVTIMVTRVTESPAEVIQRSMHGMRSGVVGAPGFEPGTFGSQRRRSNFNSVIFQYVTWVFSLIVAYFVAYGCDSIGC